MPDIYRWGSRTMASTTTRPTGAQRRVNKDRFISWFLAVQNSSIGDLVPWLVRWTQLTIKPFTTLPSDPRDLWPLRHLIRVMRRHVWDIWDIWDIRDIWDDFVMVLLLLTYKERPLSPWDLTMIMTMRKTMTFETLITYFTIENPDNPDNLCHQTIKRQWQWTTFAILKLFTCYSEYWRSLAVTNRGHN